MRKLTETEVDGFASRPAVNKAAVCNFLCSVHYGDIGKEAALGNLQMDARVAGWNIETIMAIRDGIELSAKELRDLEKQCNYCNSSNRSCCGHCGDSGTLG